jgi:DNA invertase Pin-like site-specific DNA recombinase
MSNSKELLKFIDEPETMDTNGALTRKEVISKLSQFVSGFETQQDAADELEISRVFLWRILNEKKPPSAKVLERLGFLKQVKQIEMYHLAA